MPIPVIPIVAVATVVTSAVAVVRKIHVSPVIQDVEDTLDTVDEGVSVRKMDDNRQMNGAVRWKRIVRFGSDGPGVEIDVSAIGRMRWRKV
jgi:hypothetical protein